MLVLNPQVPDYCGLAIMPSELGGIEWILGSLFMQEHYFVFDMTPKDEKGHNYVQVGIAMKNHEDKVLATHYADKNSIDAKDISHSIANPSPPPPKPDDHNHNGHIWLIVALLSLLVVLIIAVFCFRKYASKTPEELEEEAKMKASERE